MKKVLIFVIIVLIMGLSILGYFYIEKNNDYNEIFQILKNKKTESNLIINNEYNYSYDFYNEDGLFIPFELAKEYIDETLELSNSGARVYIKLDQLDFELETQELTDYVSKNLDKINIPLRVSDGEKYLNLELLSKIYPIYYKYYEEDDVLYISNQLEKIKKYVSKENKNIYYLEENLLIKFDQLQKENEFIFLENKTVKENEYLKMISLTGKIGYINKENTNLVEDNVTRVSKLNEIRDTKNLDKVNLIWDSISSYNDKKNFSVDKNDSLNIISPTWFSLNVEGIVINEASLKYMEEAHNNEYQVWALYKNSFNSDWTNQLLTNDEYVDKSIAQMLFYSSLYNIDGINIDFENIYLKNKDGLTEYIAKIRKYTKMQNIVLSIDAVVPGGSDRYSKVIDRENIIDNVDYFILMAYDEHWGTSPKSGSVASIPWVIKGIEGTLKTVDSEKLVLGVPLYTRVWTEKNNKVSSKAYSIKNIGSYLEDIDYKLTYDEKLGQNYIETKKNGNTIKIWLEDKESIINRINLINEYSLKGIAGWRKGYEEDYYYDLIDIYLKY